jgi:peptidoglycan-associated lipoprotein
MNSVSKKLYLVLVSAAAILAGCAKKPMRPDPSATVLGPQGGGALNPTDVATMADANSGLQARGDFDANGQLRGALDSVYFSFNESNIKQEERAKLQAAKDYLAKNPTVSLLLEGHCDWRGTSEYNLGLGDRRASAAKKYLLSLGVSADKLETLSKGSEEAQKNGDAATMMKDRRVDLVVLKAAGAGAPAGPASPAGP